VNATRVRGFTLIELIVTLAIVGLLAAAVLPSAKLAWQREHEAELRTALRTLRTAIDDYKVAADTGRIKREADGSGYPPDLQVLVDGVDDQRSPVPGTKVYFLRRIPRDPFAADPTLAPADTWGLRSYASPPDDPQPGDDVFDVYSKSSRTGLNGVPYREW
jgi:general secretion pathway protein G